MFNGEESATDNHEGSHQPLPGDAAPIITPLEAGGSSSVPAASSSTASKQPVKQTKVRGELSADYLKQCLKTLEDVDPAQPATHRQLVDLLTVLRADQQFKLVELLWTRHAKSFDKIWSDPEILRSFLKACRVLSCYEYMLVRMTDRVYQQWEDQRSYMGIGLTYQYTSSHQYTKLFSEQRQYLERAVTHIKTPKGLQ